MIKKIRSKSIISEAVQWDGRNFDEISNFTGDWHGSKIAHEDAEKSAYKTGKMYIFTLYGIVASNVGDYIVKGINGEIYIYNPTLFNQLYEELPENNL